MVMQTKQIKSLIKVLQDTLQTTTNFYENNSKSHAFIVGYLEGTIRETINVLEESIK
mgnify:FL=1